MVLGGHRDPVHCAIRTVAVKVSLAMRFGWWHDFSDRSPGEISRTGESARAEGFSERNILIFLYE